VRAWLCSGLNTEATFRASSRAEDRAAETAPSNITSIKGTCVVIGQKGTRSVKLTPTDIPGVYDAQHVAAFAGNPNMTYVGQITSDFRTAISGNGTSTGGGGNGSFEFSGNYGDNKIAECNYKEVGGFMNRNGTLTAEMPK